MSHVATRPAASAAPLMSSTQEAEAVAFRQLRHQTKNALQRLLAQIATTALRDTPSGCALADELERRIRLSARVSDALFGFTAAPGALGARLLSMTRATVDLLGSPDQAIFIDVAADPHCPPALHTLLVRVAHELVANAVKHGMNERPIGRITVAVQSKFGGGTTLTVRDDGQGLTSRRAGEGMSVIRCLAEQNGGIVSLGREAGWTVARLRLARAGAPS